MARSFKGKIRPGPGGLEQLQLVPDNRDALRVWPVNQPSLLIGYQFCSHARPVCSPAECSHSRAPLTLDFRPLVLMGPRPSSQLRVRHSYVTTRPPHCSQAMDPC